MKKPSKKATIGIVIAAVVVVIGIVAAVFGPMIYRDVIAEPAAEAPALEIESTTPSTGDASSLAGSWTVAAGSYAGYRVDEVLNGEDVTVVGRTDDVTGEVTIDGSELTAGTVTVDLRTVTTDSSRRDGYFTSRAIDPSANPEATFTVAEAVDLTALADSGTAEIEIPGTLDINGQSRETTAQGTVTRTDAGLHVVGAIDVTWQDHGVTAPDLGFVSVEDAGVVEFALDLTRA